MAGWDYAKRVLVRVVLLRLLSDRHLAAAAVVLVCLSVLTLATAVLTPVGPKDRKLELERHISDVVYTEMMSRERGRM